MRALSVILLAANRGKNLQADLSVSPRQQSAPDLSQGQKYAHATAGRGLVLVGAPLQA